MNYAKYFFPFHRKYLQDIKLTFVQWFHSKLYPGKYCWADCVGWAFSPTRFNPYDIESSKGCEAESKEHECETCYCGSWHKGVCFDTLTKKEQQKVRDEQNPTTDTPELLTV